MKNSLFLLFALLSFSVQAQNIVNVDGTRVLIDSRTVQAEIVGGRMQSLRLQNGPDLLGNGGYGYFTIVDDSGSFSPKSSSPIVKTNNSEIADFYYELNDNFRVEMHLVFRKDEPGFYVYYKCADNGLEGNTLNSLRYALRVDEGLFDYGWTHRREGEMISSEKLANYLELIQDATYLLQDSSIYTKYDWATEKIYDYLHGLMGSSNGIWNIEASHEYSNSGPTAQELSIHGTDTGPILLSQFFSCHFGGEAIVLRDEYLHWQKIFGPHFIYLNTGNRTEMLQDAKAKVQDLQEAWPYRWLTDSLYPLERGMLSGVLQMYGGGEVDSAMVILCPEGPGWQSGTSLWQWQPYGYYYWAVADSLGNFKLQNIRPGKYCLYAYTQKGKLIDDLELADIWVDAGENVLGTVNWDARDRKKTIFQLGKADHKTGEFQPEGVPLSYGLWKDSPMDLTFDIGFGSPDQSWFYCQRTGALWKIRFRIEDLGSYENFLLKVAIAGSDANPHLDLVLNGSTLSRTDLGTDSGIRRSSLTGGKYSLISQSVNPSLFREGENTLELKCYGSFNEYKGIMYDAILLEADNAANAVHSMDLNSGIKIYQNASGNLWMENLEQIISITIYDLCGNEIFRTSNKETLDVNLKIPAVPAGIYLYRLLSQQRTACGRIVLSEREL